MTLHDPSGLIVTAIQLGGAPIGSLALASRRLERHGAQLHRQPRGHRSRARARGRGHGARQGRAREQRAAGDGPRCARARVQDAADVDEGGVERPACERIDERPGIASSSRSSTKSWISLDALVTDAVQMLRIDAGDFTIHPERHPLTAVVDATLKKFEQRLDGHDVVVQVPGDLAIDADGELLALALRQLLDNALKYSPAGIDGSRFARTRNGTDRRGRLAIPVRRFPTREQGRIFERFYRGRTGPTGSGHRNGPRDRAADCPSAWRDADGLELSPVGHDVHAVVAAWSGGGMSAGRILVVDDDPQIRRVMRVTLTGQGYEVDDAKTGEVALEKIRDERFDLVLLDMNMPGMGGLETCRAIREPVRDRDHHADGPRQRTGQGRRPRRGRRRLRDEAVQRDGAAGADPRRAAADAVDARAERARQASASAEVDFDTRRVTARGRNVRLTPKEFELLRYLVAHPNKVLPHRELLQAVWGPDYGDEVEYLRVFVNQLRKKIEANPSNPVHLLTEPWVGYRLLFARADGANCSRKS